MSRSISWTLEAIVKSVTAPQRPVRRAQTVARLIERLDRGATTEIRTARGPLKVLPQRGPHLAAAAIGFDEEEPETLAWINKFGPNEILWDIGAATGLLSMYAALDETCQVFAFEPKAASYSVLVEHLALNDLGGRVFPACLAFSNKTGLTHLSLASMAAGSGGNSVDGQPDQFGAHHSVFDQGALAYRMDDFRETFGLAQPHHIKIDVDGVESQILEGGPKTLAAVKSVIMEVEGDNAAHAGERLERFLFAAGLVEDERVRTSGSARNRLYRRA